MRVAVLNAGVIVSVVEAQDFADALQSFPPGHTARAALNTDVVPAPPGPHVISTFDFRNRFTSAELQALAISVDAGVCLLILKLTTRETVDLDDPQTVGGVDYLVSKGIVLAGRKAALLA